MAHEVQAQPIRHRSGIATWLETSRLTLAWIAVLSCSEPVILQPALPEVQPGAFEGLWIGTEVEGRSGEFTLNVAGRELYLTGPGLRFKGTFEVDAELRHLDIRITECDCDYLGETALALYELQGNELYVAGAEPGKRRRPSSLTDPGPNRVLRFERYP